MLSTLESAIYQDTKTTIGQETLLYTQLEYNLKLGLNSSTARISSCSVISNTHLSDQFIKLSNDQLTLYTWIDSSDLVGGNTEEDVLRRGFQFISPSKGMHISIGSFKPPSKGPSHKALLCQVLIGRSYAIEKSNVQNAELPPGYKSFYIQDESPHSSADYIHQYYIKNPLHILPRYLVQFDYDPQVEAASRQKQKCEDCEKEMATIYCEADKAYLCKSCDANLHKTKISKSHVRKAIGEGVDVFGNCKTHPTRQIQYFCSQCHEPVCIDCTILGSHAKYKADGEGPHTLVSVEEYFRTVLEESKTPSPHLNERLVAINDQINNIQSRADAVVEMGKQITTAIDEICSAAKKECNDIILKKLTVLNGDEHELRRQIGEINCLEEFLKYQQEGDSMACVSTWHLHQMFREKLCDFQFFRQDIDVQLDAKISGSLSVVVDQDKVALSAPPHSTSTSTSNSPQKKPNLPQRSETPQDMYYRPPSVASAYHVPSAPSPYGVLTPRMSMAGKNKLHKSPERKMERRTSDFFNEALNFGQDMMSDFDSYSQLSSK